MTRLWLTYAWKDNEDEQVDHVIQTLRAEGLGVGYDRAHLIPGQRLWAQLDAAITDPSRSDAWAIYVTRNSLASEPCQEELAYALDRTLQSRGVGFPLIGIFPEPIDRVLIPRAIATRVYVSLQDPNWAAQVAAGARVSAPGPLQREIAPYHIQEHRRNGQLVVEVRPRTGRWHPFVGLVPVAERALLINIEHGPSGRVPDICVVFGACDVEGAPTHAGKQFQNVVDPLNSAYITFSASPSEIVIGQRGDVLWQIRPRR
jgi:hypothetical protein